jgi:hypothetical protein
MLDNIESLPPVPFVLEKLLVALIPSQWLFFGWFNKYTAMQLHCRRRMFLGTAKPRFYCACRIALGRAFCRRTIHLRNNSKTSLIARLTMKDGPPKRQLLPALTTTTPHSEGGIDVAL